jgi:hypothetical protein
MSQLEHVGKIIVDLHKDLHDLRNTIEASGGPGSSKQAAMMHSALEQATVNLQHKAREVLMRAQEEQSGVAAYGKANATIRAPSEPPPAVRAPPRFNEAREAYGLKSSMRAQCRPRRGASTGNKIHAKMTAPKRLLPRPNRLDPLAEPPSLTEADLNHGLESLQRRGFIPPAADLTPALDRGFPVVTQRPAPLYDKRHQFLRREIATAPMSTMVKLDLRPLEVKPLLPSENSMFMSEPASPVRALPAPEASPRGLEALTDGGGANTFFTELPSITSPVPYEDDTLVSDAEAQEQRETWAATTIASHWKGAQERRRFDHRVHLDGAARKIQSMWGVVQQLIHTRAEVQRVREEERKYHKRLMYELGQDWFHTRQQRRVEVHICSQTTAEHRRSSVVRFQPRQCAQIGRVFRVLDSKTDVIFVAPKYLHEDILDYYAKIMQFRGIKNPPGRFQVVVPENGDIHDNLSLSQALLCSPKAMKRIKKLVGGRKAYIVPTVVTDKEIKLCSELGLPLFGAGPKNASILASKSNAKRLVQLAELPAGPWAVDIYDEDEFYTSFAGLIVRHPGVRTWVIKIEDEESSRGTAYIDINSLKAVTDLVRRSRADTDGTTPDDDPSLDVGAVRQVLQRSLPKKVVLCNRQAYASFQDFMVEISRVGCIIQAAPENVLSYTSVHIRIDPDGQTNVLGTSEAVMHEPFVRAASWYPHTRGSFEVLKEVGMRMGRVLAAKGLVGFTSIDVVFFENPEFDHEQAMQEERSSSPAVIGSDTPVDPELLMFNNLRSPSPPCTAGSESCDTPSVAGGHLPELSESRQADYDLAVKLKTQGKSNGKDPVSLMLGNLHFGTAGPLSRWACWIVDVDARMTDEAATLWPLQFISQTRFEAATGDLLLVPEAPRTEDQAADRTRNGTSSSSQFGTSEVGGSRSDRRWALVGHAAHVPGLEKMNYNTLFQVAKMKGASFDLFNNVGCTFIFLDVFNALFSLAAIERSPDHCIQRLAGATAALMDGISPKGISGAKQDQARKPPPGVQTAPHEEAYDGLHIQEVQAGLRLALRRFTDKGKKA